MHYVSVAAAVQDSGTGNHRKPYAVEPQLAHRGGWGCLRFNHMRLNRTPVFLRLEGPAVGRLGGGYSSRARLTAVEPPGTRTQGVAVVFSTFTICGSLFEGHAKFVDGKICGQIFCAGLNDRQEIGRVDTR